MGIVFNGELKQISLDSNTLNLPQLWSSWVDWFLISDNSKYPVAFSQLGGNAINEAEGTFVPLYFFLLNGWKIKPREANHTLAVSGGILLVDGGGDPFINTTGNYVVRINYQQPVQAITVTTGGGGSGISAEEIANAVWNKMTSDGILIGSMGDIVANKVAKEESLEIVNNGVKKASKLIPHNQNI